MSETLGCLFLYAMSIGMLCISYCIFYDLTRSGVYEYGSVVSYALSVIVGAILAIMSALLVSALVMVLLRV